MEMIVVLGKRERKGGRHRMRAAAVLGGRAANQSFSSTVSGQSNHTSNTGASNIGLLMELGSLTAANLTAGEWVIAWNVRTAPIDYV